jgi:hypothetical protein
VKDITFNTVGGEETGNLRLWIIVPAQPPDKVGLKRGRALGSEGDKVRTRGTFDCAEEEGI